MKTVDTERSGTLLSLQPGDVHALLSYESEILTRLVQRRLDLDDAEQLALALVMLDGVLREEDLLPALESVSTGISCHGEEAWIAWQIRGCWNRRILSTFTTAIAYRLSTLKQDWGACIRSLEGKLQLMKLGSLAELRLNAARYGLLHLGGALTNVIAGQLRHAALDPDRWLRQYGKRAPMAVAETVPVEQGDALIEAQDRCSERILSQGPRSPKLDDFVRTLGEITAGINAGGSSSRAFDSICRKAAKCSEKLPDAGPVGAVLYSWVLAILVDGTELRDRPSVSTITNYLREALDRLNEAIVSTGKHPLAITTEEWQSILLRVLGEKPSSSRSAAVRYFLRYVHEELGLDQVWLPRRKDEEEPIPRAQIIWPHEWPAIAQVIESANEDPRVVAQCRVLMTLHKNVPLRGAECSGLVLSDLVDLAEHGIQVKVRRKRYTPDLKSQAARRTLLISNPDSVALIRAWLHRRESEGAQAGDFLFGDPYKARQLYRFSKTNRLWTRALREGTGDPSIVPHASRHTYASLTTEASAFWGVLDEVSPQEQLRACMGHANFATTLETYCHLLERPIRRALDAAIERIPFGSTDAARWMNVSVGSIRVRKHRSNGTAASIFRQWVLSCRPADCASELRSLDPADDAKPANANTAMPACKVREYTLDAEQVLKIIDDWRSGLKTEAISLRSGLPAERVGTCIEFTRRACVLVYSARGSPRREVDWPQWFSEQTKLHRLQSGATWNRLIQELVNWSEDERSDCSVLLACCHSIGLAVRGDQAVGNLLVRLRAAGRGGQELVLRTEFELLDETKNQTRIGRQLLGLQDMFTDPALLHEIVSDKRRGRPDAYLLPLTKAWAHDTPVPNAISDYKTLVAFLIVAFAFFSVQGSGRDGAEIQSQ